MGAGASSAPIVFLNGSADPADPPANVAAAPSTMRQATLVTVPGGGHGVLTQGCLLTQVSTFIDSGRPVDRARWTACAQASSPPPFPLH